MMQTEMVDDRRRALRERAGCVFVERDEFHQLLVSTRRMVRSDEPAFQVRGLLDVETGRRFLIEHEQLYGR